MIVPTCAKCDRPFPANDELASLPHGRRVAFDPELGRVWRICTKCGEWNGVTDAGLAAVTIDALRERVRDTAPIDQSAGAALFKTGRLEVMELSPRAPAAAPLAARTSAIARERGMFVIGSIGLLLVVGAMFLLHDDPRPIGVQQQRDWIGGLPMSLPVMISILLLAAAFRSKRLSGRYGQWRFMLAIIFFGSAFAVRPWEPRTSALLLGSMLVLVAVFAVVFAHMPMGRTRLSSGKRRWITRRTVDETRLLWDEARVITLRLPGGERIEGGDALTVLRDLLHASSWEHNHVMVAMAAELAQGPDPLAPVLYKLRPALKASPDGIMLANINVIDRIALDLALATRVGATGKLVQIMQRAPMEYQRAGVAA